MVLHHRRRSCLSDSCSKVTNVCVVVNQCKDTSKADVMVPIMYLFEWPGCGEFTINTRAVLGKNNFTVI